MSRTDASSDRRVLSVSRVVEGRPERIYGILADYREGHPSILPRPPFVSLDVEEGGRGAGSVIRVTMKVLGRSRTFRAVVSEPVPGRELIETNDTGYVTTFSVEPLPRGDAAEVTIATDLVRRGPAARVERWLSARLLRPVYERELELLEAAARG